MSAVTRQEPSTRVAVIGGGANNEHDVSLASAAAVLAALSASYDVMGLTIDRAGMWRDSGGHPIGLPEALHVLRSCDVVFPAVHGAPGEDGALAAVCALVGVPCVGSPASAGAAAMDKHLSRLIAADAGIAVAPATLLTAATADAHRWTHPVVVKPVSAGSSQGVSLVESADAMAAALKEAFAHDDRVLVENVVLGREIDVAVFGTHDGARMVAPPLEIVSSGIFDYATKYGGTADLRVPADLAVPERELLCDTAIRMYDALGCRGLARIDFFLTDEGPVLLEVNTMPGLTEHSQAPRMFAAAGVGYAELLDRMVQDALR